MRDNGSSSLLDIQGPRLMRAFLRIRGEDERSALVELAERLAEAAHSAPTKDASNPPTQFPT
jgi:hypothetical protein